MVAMFDCLYNTNFFISILQYKWQLLGTICLVHFVYNITILSECDGNLWVSVRCAHSIEIVEDERTNERTNENHCHNNYKYDDCARVDVCVSTSRTSHISYVMWCEWVCVHNSGAHMPLNIAHEHLTANTLAWNWTHMIVSIPYSIRRYKLIYIF